MYEGYPRAIVDGNLRPRQQVLATRVLAKELGISRIPVMSVSTRKTSGEADFRVDRERFSLENLTPGYIILERRAALGT